MTAATLRLPENWAGVKYIKCNLFGNSPTRGVKAIQARAKKKGSTQYKVHFVVDGTKGGISQVPSKGAPHSWDALSEDSQDFRQR